MAKKAREASLAQQQASVAATTKTPTSGQHLSSLGNNESAGIMNHTFNFEGPETGFKRKGFG